MNLETCSICTQPIRRRDHEICRACCVANGWNPSRFGYFPERLADRNAHRRTGGQQ